LPARNSASQDNGSREKVSRGIAASRSSIRDEDVAVHKNHGSLLSASERHDLLRGHFDITSPGELRNDGGASGAASRLANFHASAIHLEFHLGVGLQTSGELTVAFASPAANAAPGSPRKAAAIALWTTAGVSTVAALVTGAIALDAARTYATTPTRAVGEDALRTYTASGAAFIATAILAVSAASIGFGVYPWVTDKEIGIVGRF